MCGYVYVCLYTLLFICRKKWNEKKILIKVYHLARKNMNECNGEVTSKDDPSEKEKKKLIIALV